MLVMLGLLLAGGCARYPNIDKTPLTPKSYVELEGYLRGHRPELDLFRLAGPFTVDRRDNLALPLPDAEVVEADLFVPAHADRTPLVVFLHGYGNSKDSHAYQALHVASWGMHALTLQLSPNGPWVANGKILARVVDLIQRRPELLGARVDTGRIILVGHSFGGAAVGIALAEKARAVGGILLDPAGEAGDLPAYLQRVVAPVLVLGADERVSVAVNRDYFYYFIRGNVMEVSIADAVHEDAQFPAEDAHTTEALQITFAAAIASASYSLALTRGFNYAWSSFKDDLANGKLIKARRK